MPQPIDRLYDSIARNPGAIAVTGDSGGGMTYAELGAAVEALAAALQSIDPTPGNRVGICASNSVEHLVALLATYAAGKVWVPLNPRNGRAELDAMIATTRPRILLADRVASGRLTRTDAPLLFTDGDGDDGVRGLIAKWAGSKPKRVELDAEQAQIIKFSGGSTGAPKAVVQSRRCINAQADGIRDVFEFDRGDVNLIAAPITHGASCFVLPILEVGGCHVLLENARGTAVLDAIQRHSVTTMYAPPTLIYTMLDVAALPGAATRSLRHLIYSAAPMSADRIRECQRVFGPVIETAYGQVEAPQIVTAMRASELLLDENLTSVGRPSPVAVVGVMGDDGKLLQAGDVGEIVIRGPLLMSGYLDRPDATSAAIVDGWLHTGDVGLTDDRGYLFIRGRLRELINTGGFKVFPGDVEAVLSRHPAVLECAVFGVEDPKWGEAVHAAVVLRPGILVKADELILHVKAELGSVKAPKRVHFLAQLERNAAGKVSRSAVREGLALPGRR